MQLRLLGTPLRSASAHALSRLALRAALLVLGAGAASAQFVPIGGNVYDGAGGPLLAGTVYHAINHVTVPAGQTLTVEPGAIVKFGTGLQWIVNGVLDVGDEGGENVVATSVEDDTAGGDTNGDGASSGVPGDWYGIAFNSASDASTLRGLEVRFAGTSFYGNAAVTLSAADITLQGCIVRDCAFAALDLANTSQPTVSECSFLDNGGGAVRNASLAGVPRFTDNVASGNAGGNFIEIASQATAGSDVTIALANCLNDALVVGANLAVAQGATLTLGPGVTLKFRGATKAEILGTLDAQGTSKAPVVITSFADDSVAGDTNGDGPSTGAPGDWIGMTLGPSADASTLRYLEIRHAGWWFYAAAGLTLDRCDALLEHCTVRRCAHAALDLSSFGGVASLPTVTSCSFVDNGAIAIDNASIDALPGLLHNEASGNGGNYVEVNDTSPAADVTLSPANGFDGVLVFANGGTVPAGATLTLQPGVIVKWRSPGGVDVQGAVRMLGTAAHPVVLTSFRDDAFGGDTNADGPSTGLPGDWDSVRIGAGAGASRVEHTRLRYGGYYYAAPMLWSFSPSTTARSVRAEHGYGGGIEVSALQGDAENWVAFDCAGIGIHLTGGAFDLVHATSAGNGGAGVRTNGVFAGTAANSISWGNAGGNFVGFGASQLRHCDGSSSHAGANGNIDSDPLFVDASPPVGDLGLAADSPCVEAADAGLAPALLADHVEGSRLLDAHLDGGLVSDMGAYEHSVWWMSANGVPRVGASMELVVNGSKRGFSYYRAGNGDGHQITAWGYLGAGSTTVFVGGARVGVPRTFVIPDEAALVGTQIAIQTITLERAWVAQWHGPAPLYPGGGNVTNLYRATILP